jgi:hypothetical protein
MKTPLFKKETLANMRSWLTDEDKLRLQTEFNLSQYSIRNILIGSHLNNKVLAEAMRMAVKNKADAEKTMEEVSENENFINAPAR